MIFQKDANSVIQNIKSNIPTSLSKSRRKICSLINTLYNKYLFNIHRQVKQLQRPIDRIQ